MAYINDASIDLLLADIRDASDELHILSAEPTTYSEVATYSLGDKVSPTIAAPSDRSGGGREIVVAAITDGSVNADGDASHWAIVKAAATSRLLATGSLSSTQTVTNGNPFTLAQFTIGVPDAV